MKAKKSLGQHFLRSEKALSSIIDAGDPNAGDLILEIGPGEGVLTERLLKWAGKVVAIEKDDYLYEMLREKFSWAIREGRLDLIHRDILDFDPSVLKFYGTFTYKIIANIPYYITGSILKKFLSAKHQPERMVLLVQKEGAKRIEAKDKKESVLSISVKAYGKPQYVETVKAGSFSPAPKVDSAILVIEEISRNFFDNLDEKKFFEMVKVGFGSKRKKLISNLAQIYKKDDLKKAFELIDLDENTRAEDINLETWKKLGNSLI